MSQTAKGNNLVAPVLGLFTVLVTALAFIVWDQVLDFDPCNNVLKHPGADCLEPGLAGIIVGGAVIFLGLSFARGAVRKGRETYGRWLEPLLFLWSGLMVATTGAAVVYAQWTLGI